MRIVLALLTILVLTGCTAAKVDSEIIPARRPLIEFKDVNFGVRFSHTDALTTEYNPHGGADVVIVAWKGEAIGGLKIGRRPPEGRVKDFIAAGVAYYKEKYATPFVTYSLYKSPNGYKWHHMLVRTKADDGTNYVLDRFVYLKDVDDLFGSFSFEFVCAENKHELVGPEIMTVINSFTIEKESSPAPGARRGSRAEVEASFGQGRGIA